MRLARLLAGPAVLSLALSRAVVAQADHDHTAEQIGRVAFPTSCGAAAQQRFERGVAYLHSFW